MSQLTVIYATETGNSEDLAKKTKETAEAKGIEVKLVAVEDYSVDDLASESRLVFIGSTQGDGEPPECGWDFHDALKEASLDLSGLSYSVVALGDTSYGDMFCAFGKFVEGEFNRMGAKSIVPRVDCDYDFDDTYADWNERFFAAIA